MATSSAVVSGDLATATNYNNLRTDVLTTHVHDGSDGSGGLGGNVGTGMSKVRVQDNGLLIDNPAGSYNYTVTAAAIGANRVLNLPLITGTDTLAALGMTNTWTAA